MLAGAQVQLTAGIQKCSGMSDKLIKWTAHIQAFTFFDSHRESICLKM